MIAYPVPDHSLSQLDSWGPTHNARGRSSPASSMSLLGSTKSKLHTADTSSPAAFYPSPVLETAFMPNFRPYLFLLVDDNEINLRILERVLAKLFPNAAIRTVQDSALVCVNPQALLHYHVIFLDIEMPIVTGVDIATHVRSNPLLDHVGLIAVTTRSMAADLELYTRCGFDFTFPKPVDHSYGYILLQVEQVLRARCGEEV